MLYLCSRKARVSLRPFITISSSLRLLKVIVAHMTRPERGRALNRYLDTLSSLTLKPYSEFAG